MTPRRQSYCLAQPDFRVAVGDADHPGSRHAGSGPAQYRTTAEQFASCSKSARCFSPTGNDRLPLGKGDAGGAVDRCPRVQAAWHTRETECDFYDIKGAVEGLVLSLGIGQLAFTAQPDRSRAATTRAGQTAGVLLDGADARHCRRSGCGRSWTRYNLKQRVRLFLNWIWSC